MTTKYLKFPTKDSGIAIIELSTIAALRLANNHKYFKIHRLNGDQETYEFDTPTQAEKVVDAIWNKMCGPNVCSIYDKKGEC